MKKRDNRWDSQAYNLFLSFLHNTFFISFHKCQLMATTEKKNQDTLAVTQNGISKIILK